MADTETADDARDTRAVGYDRLAIASITLSVVGLVLAVATWAAWLLLIRPTPLRIYRTGLAGPVSSYMDIVGRTVTYVIGSLWFAVLPVSVLSIVLAWLELRLGPRPESEAVARAAVVAGAVALLLALAGAIVFSIRMGQAPVIPLQNEGA